jgi:hypothetical protein
MLMFRHIERLTVRAFAKDHDTGRAAQTVAARRPDRQLG